ncbi:CLUMA_CG003579, isoform A [Clunio marinus]|uniref:CLUMA_CG003579, isoform A n=1 Tax=Clunio marinus TaxID=568069 RepID=A0A1J1HNW1_9DIPT|nr:CLUMA_CG003579, isoform A [Clunio marinus]
MESFNKKIIIHSKTDEAKRLLTSECCNKLLLHKFGFFPFSKVFCWQYQSLRKTRNSNKQDKLDNRNHSSVNAHLITQL